MEDNKNLFYQRLRRYCLLQERCVLEIKNKMRLMKIDTKHQEKALKYLITNDYINEERFARALSRGKFKKNCWGKIKIAYQLRKKEISNENIKKGLEEIDNTEYNTILESLIEKKKQEVKNKDIFTKKGKISKFLIQKGFEKDLVWDKIKKAYK